MPLNHELKREDLLGSYLLNRLQDFLSAARTDLRLSLKNSTDVQVIPDAELGIAAIAIQGRWRYIEKTISRSHPGGAKGTFTIWAVAKDNEVDNTPKVLTDHTDYAFDLRITKGEEAPSGEGVVVYEKIGEIDWSGTEIEALRQTHGSVTGPMILDGALSSESPSDITWTRAANGGLIAGLKKDSVGANEIAAEGVGSSELAALAVIAAKLAAEAVETGKLANLAVTEAKLANEGVATGKIKNLAVTLAKIANEAVSAAKIAEGAVTEEKLAELAVTAAKIAANAVIEAKIADGAVTSRKAKLTTSRVEGGSVALNKTEKLIVAGPLKITPAVKSHLLIWATFRRASSTKGQADFWAFADGAEKAFLGTLAESTVAEASQAQGSTSGAAVIENLSAAAHEIDLRATAGVGTCTSVASYFTYLLVAA